MRRIYLEICLVFHSMFDLSTESAKPLFVQTFTHPPITLLYHIWLKIVTTKASATLVIGQLYKVSLVFSSLPSSRIYTEKRKFSGRWYTS